MKMTISEQKDSARNCCNGAAPALRGALDMPGALRQIRKADLRLLLRHWAGEQGRVKPGLEPVDSPIEMRPGDPAGRTHRPQFVASRDPFAHSNREGGEVGVDRG